MSAKKYIPRIVDALLREDLSSVGAVALEGPKACGKTVTARQFTASEVLLDVDRNAAQLAQIDPGLILEGPTPRLIDEWQLEPAVWNAVRRAVDERSSTGQFLLTGSASPQPDALRHSGAGRMARIRMRPMTLWESGESSGDVSLVDLTAGNPARGRSDLQITDYARLIVRGGWPENIGARDERAERFTSNYLTYATEHSIPVEGGVRHDPVRFQKFLRSYAQVTAQPTPLSRIITRVVGEDSPKAGRAASPTWHTADAYRDAAEQFMLIEDLPAWSPELRSQTRLAELAKRHFVDPSLAASLLGANPRRLLDDPNTLGFLFESLATRDLRVYAETGGGQVFHYRERDGALEADIIVEWRNGDWIGVEVKLGATAVDTASSALLKLAKRRIARKPQALIVLTASEYAYRRDDGVDVVPLGALRP